jgi:hypothetical protein
LESREKLAKRLADVEASLAALQSLSQETGTAMSVGEISEQWRVLGWKIKSEGSIRIIAYNLAAQARPL